MNPLRERDLPDPEAMPAAILDDEGAAGARRTVRRAWLLALVAGVLAAALGGSAYASRRAWVGGMIVDTATQALTAVRDQVIGAGGSVTFALPASDGAGSRARTTTSKDS